MFVHPFSPDFLFSNRLDVSVAILFNFATIQHRVIYSRMPCFALLGTTDHVCLRLCTLNIEDLVRGRLSNDQTLAFVAVTTRRQSLGCSHFLYGFVVIVGEVWGLDATIALMT